MYFILGPVLSHTSLGSGLDRETPHSVLNLCLGFKGKVGKVETGNPENKRIEKKYEDSIKQGHLHCLKL